MKEAAKMTREEAQKLLDGLTEEEKKLLMIYIIEIGRAHV